jgi:hypothetical protein
MVKTEAGVAFTERPRRGPGVGAVFVFPMIYLVLLLVVLHRWVLAPRLRQLRAGDRVPPARGHEPTVTVVVPMFNAGRRAARTIRSVMALDYPVHRLELVVVDDGSTDDSHAVADWAATPYPNAHVLRNREHMGWRWSFDRVVRRCAADLVLSLEPGDELDPPALRHLVDRLGPDMTAVGARVLPGRARGKGLARSLETVRCFLDEAWLRSLDAALGSLPCTTSRATLFRRGALAELPALAARWAPGPHDSDAGGDPSPIRQLLARGHWAITALDAVCYSASRPTLRGRVSRWTRRAGEVRAQLLGALRPAWQRAPSACALHLVTVALLAALPAVALQALVSGRWLELAALGAATVPLALAVFARWSRRLAREQRVGALWLLPGLILMPLTSALLAPLAAFTLHLERAPAGETASEPSRRYPSGVPARVPSAPER